MSLRHPQQAKEEHQTDWNWGRVARQTDSLERTAWEDCQTQNRSATARTTAVLREAAV